jgi:glycosyltransferase involved in cell wall biosynthesis
LKVDFWDVRELANQIVAVVQNDALRDELHRNVHHEFTKLSWDDAAAKLLRVFETKTQEVPA